MGGLCYSDAKILYFGSGGGCNNEGVHKGLVLKVIVIWSLSSQFNSTLCVFLTHELVVKLAVVLLWTGCLQPGKEGGLELGGCSCRVCFMVCVGGSASPSSFVSALRRVSFVVREFWWGALVLEGRE